MAAQRSTSEKAETLPRYIATGIVRARSLTHATTVIRGLAEAGTIRPLAPGEDFNVHASEPDIMPAAPAVFSAKALADHATALAAVADGLIRAAMLEARSRKPAIEGLAIAKIAAFRCADRLPTALMTASPEGIAEGAGRLIERVLSDCAGFHIESDAVLGLRALQTVERFAPGSIQRLVSAIADEEKGPGISFDTWNIHPDLLTLLLEAGWKPRLNLGEKHSTTTQYIGVSRQWRDIETALPGWTTALCARALAPILDSDPDTREGVIMRIGHEGQGFLLATLIVLLGDPALDGLKGRRVAGGLSASMAFLKPLLDDGYLSTAPTAHARLQVLAAARSMAEVRDRIVGESLARSSWNHETARQVRIAVEDAARQETKAGSR